MSCRVSISASIFSELSTIGLYFFAPARNETFLRSFRFLLVCSSPFDKYFFFTSSLFFVFSSFFPVSRDNLHSTGSRSGFFLGSAFVRPTNGSQLSSRFSCPPPIYFFFLHCFPSLLDGPSVKFQLFFFPLSPPDLPLYPFLNLIKHLGGGFVSPSLERVSFFLLVKFHVFPLPHARTPRSSLSVAYLAFSAPAFF